MTIRQGHNVIAGSSGRHLQDAFPLFFDHRFTFDPQDIRWVNSEDYSWLDGEVYKGGYNKLLSQYQPTGTFRAASLNYTCVFSDLSIVETSVPTATGTVADLQTWATSAGYTTTGVTLDDLVVHKSLTSSSETINNVVISFYRCHDKKKIVLTDQIAAVEAIYAATGVAEYFVLDIANKQFKLPRNKWGKYGTGSGDLGDYIAESVPNITGDVGNESGIGHVASVSYGLSVHNSSTSGAFYAKNDCHYTATKQVEQGTDGKSLGFDASLSSQAYQDGAPVQPRGAKGDLYFYLGDSDADIVGKAHVTDALLQSKASVDLNNLTASGKNIANWSSNLTNCITNIPQDIKLELSNGALTLKAGSKVYDGNGLFGEIPQDIQNATGTVDAQVAVIVCRTDDNGYVLNTAWMGQSAEQLPASTATFQVWYNTTDKKCYFDIPQGWVECSFPIALGTSTTTSWASIDQVFNGFGYIGSTVFALPGVKGLIPDGRNADGSLKNIELTYNYVITKTFTGTADTVLIFRENSIGEGNRVTYHESINYNEYGYTETDTRFCITGSMTITAGVISNFTPKLPFHAVDRNDSSWIAQQAMPSSKYDNLTLGASGTPYVAPATGEFRFVMNLDASDYFAIFNGNSSDVADLIDIAVAAINQNYVIKASVSKGQTIRIQYSGYSANQSSRFYYAEGEQ